MTARFDQRLSRLEQRAQDAGVACSCPPHPLVVFCGDRMPDIEPCPVHGPIPIILWPLPKNSGYIASRTGAGLASAETLPLDRYRP